MCDGGMPDNTGHPRTLRWQAGKRRPGCRFLCRVGCSRGRALDRSAVARRLGYSRSQLYESWMSYQPAAGVDQLVNPWSERAPAMTTPVGAENLGSVSLTCGAGDGHAAGWVRQDAVVIVSLVYLLARRGHCQVNLDHDLLC